jgi:hypothetical protein
VKEKENVYNNFVSTSLSDFKVEFKMERIFKQIKEREKPIKPASPSFLSFPAEPDQTTWPVPLG